MLIPKLKYQLQWTPTASGDIHILQTKINHIMFTKGLPRVLSSKVIHSPAALNFGNLEDAVHKAHWTSYFLLIVKSMDPLGSATTAAATERECILRATAHFPPGLQGLNVFSHPHTGRHLLSQGTMARAVCERLCHCGVWWQTTDDPVRGMVGAALPASLTAPELEELLQLVQQVPELVLVDKWNDDTGLWIDRAYAERFPQLTAHMGEALPTGAVVSRWPTQDTPFIPGSFCVIPHIANAQHWSAFIMQIQQPEMGDPFDQIRVKTLTVDPSTTIYRLPIDTNAELVDADICSAIAMIPHPTGGWAIALEHQALIKSYQPNQAARRRLVATPWATPAGSEVYTDGSYDGEAVGLAAVSNCDSHSSVQCYGGWESELSTAQEGEIIAMALALQGISTGGTIHTDSQFAHDIANKRAQPGRFAPFICKFIRQKAAQKSAHVKKVKAHVRTVEDHFPSNHYADQWAKLGTQRAFGLLQRGHIPREWRPNTTDWITIHSSDGLWLHDPRRFPRLHTLSRPSWYKWLDLKAKVKVELVLTSYWGTDFMTKACRLCAEDVDTSSHPLLCATQTRKGELLQHWYKSLKESMPWPMWRLPWIPLWPSATHTHASYRQSPQGFANDDTARHEFHPPQPNCTVIDKRIIGWASHIDPSADPARTLEKWAPRGWVVIPPAPVARILWRNHLYDQWTSYSDPLSGEWTCPSILATIAPHCMALRRSQAKDYTLWSTEECPPPSPLHGPASKPEAELGVLTTWAPADQSAQEALQTSGGCPLLGIWELDSPNEHVLDVTLSQPDYSFSGSAVKRILAVL